MRPFRSFQRPTRRNASRLPLLLCLLLAAPFAAAAPAWAATQGPSVIVKVHQASGLISPYFQLAATPGHTLRAGTLELVNPTGGTVRATLDPVDAITTNTLGSAYSLTDTGRHGATTWLRLSRRMVRLAPHARQFVRVAVVVPGGASAGDYLAGVSVEALGQTQSKTVSRGLAIGEIDRYAIGVETRLPGPRHPAVHFTGASVVRQPSGLAFLLSAANSGNVILKDVHGSVKVTDGRRIVATATITPDTFVSHTRIQYPLPAPREQPVPGARYRVRATMHYAGSVARLDTSVRFSHAAAVTQQNYGGRKLPQSGPPWSAIAGAFLALAAVAILVMLVRRRTRPLSRRAGLSRLDRGLARPENLPVSILHVSAHPSTIGTVAALLRPRLRRTDRVCRLGDYGLLVICPATSQAAAHALRRDLDEQLARRPELANHPVGLTFATAEAPVSAQRLLQHLATSRGHGQPARVAHDRQPAAAR